MSALRGLYVITRPHPDLTMQTDAALRGGARIVQYRDKSADGQRRLAEARALRELTRQHDALLLINDDIDLAIAVDADGVHVGREDAACREARRQLGDDTIIGVSCYDRLELARAAQNDGADYVAFGSFFPSPTKPDAVRADVALLKIAHAELSVPVCAIGGITIAVAPLLLHAGADMLAVISDIYEAEDIEAAARAYAAAFTA
ncbi:MAG: thiamine phosphate synthase [Chromatiales bacterium]|nr:thiamine phosphate synthase [Chromatiales bacterium]